MSAGAAFLVLLVAGALWLWRGGNPSNVTLPSPAENAARVESSRDAAASLTDDADVITRAFKAEKSDVMVECTATVKKVLPDDNETPRHQRLIVILRNDHTVLIAHNIDLAERVPIKVGEKLRFRGEYEWNQEGGVIHWTHHDPGDRREGGWIEHDGVRYE
jgi:hypothetical protein